MLPRLWLAPVAGRFPPLVRATVHRVVSAFVLSSRAVSQMGQRASSRGSLSMLSAKDRPPPQCCAPIFERTGDGTGLGWLLFTDGIALGTGDEAGGACGGR
jgi:hypothetical protein